MKRLSITTIWDETTGYLSREGALVAPIALATIGLSDAAASLITGTLPIVKPADTSALPVISLLAVMILSLIGQMAILALALSPGTSVAEAMRKGLSRLPKLILVTLVLVWIVVLLAMPLVLMLGASGIDLGVKAPKLPLTVTLYSFCLIGVLAWLSARLLPVNALIVDRNPRLGETLRTAFAMTRGHTPILLGLMGLYLLVWLIVSGAVGFVLGSVFTLVGKMLGMASVGKVLAALAGGVVAAAMGAVSAVFIAKLYQHLSAEKSGI
jgi:hypothetical protein